jgi:phospholipid/cholesterol/gamma-HCH transport system substrate-binding protein
MSDRSVQIKVGFLVLICLFLFVMFVFALGDINFEDQVTYKVDFRSAGGMTSGAGVKVAGIRSGKVSEVEYLGPSKDYPGDDEPLVRVHVSVNEDLADSIRQNATFHISTSGMLGGKYVEIDPGTPDQPILDPEKVILGKTSAGLGSMMSKADQLVSSLVRVTGDNEGGIASILETTQKTLDQTRKLVEDNREGLDASMKRMDKITRDLSKIVDGLKFAIGDGSEIKNMISDGRQAMSNTRKLTARINSSTTSTMKDLALSLEHARKTMELYREVGEASNEKIISVLDRMDKLTAELNNIALDVRRGKGVVGALLQDPELFDDLKEMIRDLKRHPWKFLWKE